MDYKKIIKNQKVRLKILSMLDFIPDILMLHIQYFIKFNRFLNLKNPKRFSEKIQWYKLYYRDPLMKICTDKYLVRDYVKSKGIGEILTELYGVYKKIEKIKFDDFPKQFVIKKTNGGGGNNVIICKDKNNINFNKVKNEIKNWLSNNKISSGREWSYRNLTSKIIFEEYLKNKGNKKQGITDYKFFCFDGKPYYILICKDRHNVVKKGFFDLDLNYIDIGRFAPKKTK